MHSGKLARFSAFLGLALLILTAAPAAAFTITDVVNAASRIPSGSPGYGIAQGAIFVVTGTGVGPDQFQQATFPLPTSAGLGGVSIKVSVGGTTVDAIMVYVSSTEVAAILPSKTPTGTGTVTVANGSDTATAPITVVASAFGIFTAASGSGPALAFNAAGDGTNSPNGLTQSAQPGQTLIINGTGLGAITSDETQSGVTDVPSASANITVWVGSAQATVVSAARGTCCTGLDPNFKIPQGVAGWDVVTVTIPSGASGCQVSVAVQTGNVVSNVGTISVSSGGGLCVDVSGIDLGALTSLSGKVKFGLIYLTRISTTSAAVSILIDAGAAAFTQVDLGSNTVQVPTQAIYSLFGGSAGNCTVVTSRSSGTTPPTTSPGNPGSPGSPGPIATLLDAGPAINVTSPKGTKQMTKQTGGAYAGTFANASSISLVPGMPPISQGGPPFLDPGTLTADNGGGGADIGPFSVSLTNPSSVTWTNPDQITTVNRAQGLTVTWSGGDPSAWVGIAGTAIQIQGGASVYGSFVCVAPSTAGQFTVPSYVTLSLPPVAANNPAGGTGTLSLSSTIYKFVSIPGVDLTSYFASSSTGKSVAYQ